MAVMRLDELLRERATTLSCEFFPPKNEVGWTQYRSTVEELAGLGPDFLTVTYGAGGSSRDRTKEAVAQILHSTSLPAVSHLTCVGQTRDELHELLDDYHQAGICNLLALRGDPPAGQARFEAVPGGCAYASELLELIAADGRFATACAAFPEGHPEAEIREQDWRHLIGKFEAGASMAITQCFFHATPYAQMMAWLERELGQRPHVVPGIMPIKSWPWLQSFVDRFCPTASLPDSLRERLAPLAGDEEASDREGLAITIGLCRELLHNGAPGLHLYTLNRPEATREIIETLRADGLLG